ncbi:LysR family transcriptional regulator [Hominifimenecus sp. rT4P-3]|uniref:LysR family transcriptional regulator n=1 Tax=Hominifimenecus sp. rT4P-3 TaxID=3242979 RepID=UPI003DA5193D
MDLFQLKCFVRIVDCKSFTEASYEEAISQSSLSKYISKLEDELKVKLFDRSKRQVELTPAGREFEQYARTMLNEYEQMKHAMKKYSVGGILHIGSIEHMGRVGLTTPIASFLNQFPDGDVEIEIEKGDTLSLMNLLAVKKIDMAFIAHIISAGGETSNIDGYDLAAFDRYTLVEDEYHLIVSRNHPLAGKTSVSWAALAEEKLVILDQSYSLNAVIRDSFRQAGIVPHIAFECDQVDTILGLVEENFGVSLLSKRVATAQYDVTAIRLDRPLSRNTVLVVPKEIEKKRKLIQQFVCHMVKYYEKDGQGGSRI